MPRILEKSLAFSKKKVSWQLPHCHNGHSAYEKEQTNNVWATRRDLQVRPIVTKNCRNTKSANLIKNFHKKVYLVNSKLKKVKNSSDGLCF
jgi:hypothetical protein